MNNNRSAKTGKPRFDKEVRDEVIAALDIMAEYKAMGVVFPKDEPRASGKASCYAWGREKPGENSPSGWVDTITGQYGDSGASNGKAESIFDFAIRVGKCADFSSALQYFADRAGIKLPAKGKKEKPTDPNVDLKFLEWNDGTKRFAEMWCRLHKKGTSVDAIIRAGGRVARWKSYIDKTGEHRDGKHMVIAMPCYGEQLAAAPPVAWQIYDIGGGKLQRYRGDPKPPKMLSVGPTSGTLMNLQAVERLSQAPQDGEIVWKTGGPSDMLALMTAISEEKRSIHIVTCNASGEAATIPLHQAALFSDRTLYAVNDRDDAGKAGNRNWALATHGTTKEMVVFRLPFVLKDKHGDDLRDYINGKETTDGAATQAPRTLDDLLALKQQYAFRSVGGKVCRPVVSDEESTELFDIVSQAAVAAMLPTVVLPGGSAPINAAAKSLGQLMDATGKFFDRGGAVVRIERDDEARLKLGAVKPAAICSDFEKVARLKKNRRTKYDDEEAVAAICSEQTARQIIEAATFKEMLSPIKVLTDCPVLIGRDGELIQVAGYDRPSGILASGKPAPDVSLTEAIEMLGACL